MKIDIVAVFLVALAVVVVVVLLGKSYTGIRDVAPVTPPAPTSHR